MNETLEEVYSGVKFSWCKELIWFLKPYADDDDDVGLNKTYMCFVSISLNKLFILKEPNSLL